MKTQTEQTTMVAFYRADRLSESIFLVEFEQVPNITQIEALKPFFKYLPTDRVDTIPTFHGDRFIVGPRLGVETRFSSNTVEILHDCGFPSVRRVEHFRSHFLLRIIPLAEQAAKYHDPVTERVFENLPDTFTVNAQGVTIEVLPLLTQGADVLHEFSQRWQLGFSELQLEYIAKMFLEAKVNPTEVAIFQLAQVWSDHCCHLLWNSRLIIDGQEQPHTFFDLIRAPYKALNKGHNVLIAFHDNSSAIEGFTLRLMTPKSPGHLSKFGLETVNVALTISGETHCYPTLVAPYPGRATEIGGEIRDQIGTGRGSDIAFAGNGTVVGSLRFPNGYQIPGEFVSGREYLYPADKATPMKVVIDGTSGWHDYANCFGKPCTTGFFYSGAIWRPRRDLVNGGIIFERLESIKPVAFGLGVGTMRKEHVQKLEPRPGDAIIRIGGPAYRIGFCGGAGSSTVTGSRSASFDVNAVQRGNPVMERLVLEVCRALNALGIETPVRVISDSGAGGTASMLYDLVGQAGGKIFLGRINLGDATMRAVEVWICEYQESMGLIVAKSDVPILQAICLREGCPCEVLGEITDDGQFTVYKDKECLPEEEPIVAINIARAVGGMPAHIVTDATPEDVRLSLIVPHYSIEDMIRRVFHRTEVGSKRWMIRTVDGSVGGRITQNQYCGPFSTPVNDCAIATIGFNSFEGEATSIGASPAKTVLDPVAGARMAIGEMYTNLMGVLLSNPDCGSHEEALRRIKCICNWMWPANITPRDGEITRQKMAIEAATDLLKKLKNAILGGKDSSSLAVKVRGALQELVKSLETVVFSSIVPVPDIRRRVTPEIRSSRDSSLILLDLACGQRRLGASSLALSFGQLGKECPNLENVDLLKRAFFAMQELLANNLIAGGHDISEGGLVTTVAEMAFATGCGISLNIVDPDHTATETLFAEELGYVIACKKDNNQQIISILNHYRVPHINIGETVGNGSFSVEFNTEVIVYTTTNSLRRDWERTGYELTKLRINPDWAKREWRNIQVPRRPKYQLSFVPKPTPQTILQCPKHQVAIIRAKGTNGHEEMMAAWLTAGFGVSEIHMNDLLGGKLTSFDQFRGLVFPGGFADGDTLGAAMGWSQRIECHPHLRQMFATFFSRSDTFSFGTCNGAQLGLRCGFAPLPDLPKAQRPLFTIGDQEAFCHQWVTLKIEDSPAIMLRGMVGSVLGAYVANSEGRFNCDHAPQVMSQVLAQKLAPIVYVDSRGRRSNAPPYSPSGSFVAGVCDPSGRHLYIMPHPLDRSFLMHQWSWAPRHWENLKASPWLMMSQNAREWCD